MDYLSKYSGSEIEALLDGAGSGSSSGGVVSGLSGVISGLVSGATTGEMFASEVSEADMGKLEACCPVAGKIYRYALPEAIMTSLSYAAIGSAIVIKESGGDMIALYLYFDSPMQSDYYNSGFASLVITSELQVMYQVHLRNEALLSGKLGIEVHKKGNLSGSGVDDSAEVVFESSGNGDRYLGDDGSYHDIPSGGSSASFLDLTPLMNDGSTLTEEAYQTVVDAFTSGVHFGKVIIFGDVLIPITIVKDYDGSTPYAIIVNTPDSSADIMVYKMRIAISSDKKVSFVNESVQLRNDGDGDMFLSDNGNYKALPKDYVMITKAEVDAGTLTKDRGDEILAAIREGRPILYNNNSGLSETSLLGGIYSLINTYNLFLTEAGMTYLVFFDVNYQGGYGSVVILHFGRNVSGEYSLSKSSKEFDLENVSDVNIPIDQVGDSENMTITSGVTRAIIHIILSGVNVGHINIPMTRATTYGEVTYTTVCSDSDGGLFKATVSLDGEGMRNVSLTTSYLS